MNSKIVIIDDNEEEFNDIRDCIKNSSIKCETTSFAESSKLRRKLCENNNGQVLLDWLKSTSCEDNIVAFIIDINFLPTNGDKTGLKIFEQIRNYKSCPTDSIIDFFYNYIPIFIITNYDNINMKVESQKKYIPTSFISKNNDELCKIGIDQIIDEINKYQQNKKLFLNNDNFKLINEKLDSILLLKDDKKDDLNLIFDKLIEIKKDVKKDDLETTLELIQNYAGIPVNTLNKVISLIDNVSQKDMFLKLFIEYKNRNLSK